MIIFWAMREHLSPNHGSTARRPPRRAEAPWILCFATVLWAFALSPVPCWAYLDPGTGSYVLQILIAAFVGGLFALKGFWSKIKNKFRRNRSSSRDASP